MELEDRLFSSHLVGLNFEAQFTKHSGLEFGIFDRVDLGIGMKGGGPIKTAHIVSTRLSYKFYSDIVNATAGVNVDVDARDSDDIWYGLYFSVSRDIPICKGLIFEPSIHFNPVMSSYSGRYNKGLYYDGTYIGVGLKLKYRF